MGIVSFDFIFGRVRIVAFFTENFRANFQWNSYFQHTKNK